jgi:sugar lactone lactonase YvrE
MKDRFGNEQICRLGLAFLCGFGAALAATGASAAAPQAATAMSAVSADHATAPKGASVIPVCVPIGLAHYKGTLYVGNHWTSSGCSAPGQITVYNNNGKELTKRTITQDIYNPAGLAVDSHGNLYVADATKDQVTVYDPTGKQLKNKTLTTDPNYSASGVQVDSQGNVWVANRNSSDIEIGEIQIFHTNGSVTTFTSNLVYPLGIAFQPGTGDAWVANSETPNDTITSYDSNGNFLKSYPTSNFTPTYLFFKNKKVYATDGLTSQIEIFNARGKQIGAPITAGLVYPYGIAPGAKGNFYVANVGAGGTNNGSSITEYTSSGSLVCTITTTGCN